MTAQYQDDQADAAAAMCLTMLASICLNLKLPRLEDQELGAIWNAANLSRIRDDLEATALTGAPYDAPREDLELILLSLVATRRLTESGTVFHGPPDLLEAITPERVQVTTRHVMDVLDRPPTFKVHTA